MTGISKQLGVLERRSGISLALIYAFRMVGLFMIIPVFAIYAESIPDATPLLIGLALGIYGLTQSILQIPFGFLSDRIGRKPVIAMGLIIFALGSLLAASADSIYGIIAGRALQGSGAIAAALMALAADLSREEHRMKMMAFIGASIGAAFAFSMVVGPVVYEWIGISGIFVGTAVLALLGIAILYLFVPDPVDSHFHLDAEVESASLMGVFKNPDLLRLDAGIFILHFVLMSLFLVIPIEIRDTVDLHSASHWKLYLPVFAVSLVIMLPFIILAETKRMMKPVFVGAIALMYLAVVGFIQSDSAVAWIISFTLFFTAFNFLEASLPSLVSKTASALKKGTAMGVYSSSQFFGAFAGGVVGGLAHGVWGVHGVYYSVSTILLLWFFVAITMTKPRYLSTYLVKVDNVDEIQLLAIAGVIEASIIHETDEDNVAYLKVDKSILDEDKLLSFSVAVEE